MLLRKSEAQISRSRRQQQDEFFKTAHKHFIKEYLVSKNIISPQENEDLRTILKKCSAAFKNTEGLEQEELTHIIYLIYYSLATIDWKYGLRYLADRNLMIFRMKFVFTLRMLFTRKKRRSRNILL